MVANVSNDDILRTLEYIRNQRNGPKNYTKPVDTYKDYLPKTLNTKPQDTSSYYHMLNTIDQHGINQTAITATEVQNTQAYRQMLRAKREAHRAQMAAQRAKRIAANRRIRATTYNSSGGGTGTSNSSYTPGHGGRVSLNPNAPLKSYQWHQFHLTLNSSVAPHFIGFLNALYKKGYRPKVIGSYANRSIAGTSTRSLHSYGDAIDIDPSRNPVTWNGQNITALPPGVGSLAARYGLKWGGSWIHNKRDTMHFSVPYGGVE